MSGRRTPRSPRSGALVAAVAGLLGTLVVGGPSTAGDHSVVRPADRSDHRTGAPGMVHSSDGVVGPLAQPRPLTRRSEADRTDVRSHRVAPGLKYLEWSQTDDRGPVRIHLLRANLRKPGLSLRYAAPRRVASTAKLGSILKRSGAVAGVNGDFFDIADTGAPLGAGVDQRAVRHGPRQNWVHSFTVTGKAAAAIGEVPVTATVVGRPGLRITNVNSPHVLSHGIGLYTRRWGEAPGRAVTEGARRRDVREVVVRGGRVVANTRAVTRGEAVRGKVLIGRGGGARELRRIPVGARLRIRTSAAGEPRLAIGGNAPLLADGRVLTHDDGELHPRTAVGIDRDSGRLLLVVVDGRQEHSRGYTMLELAQLMAELGAEDALNLDGGGSSTMLARGSSGKLQVANSPSDGAQRRVPNGLQLHYRAR